MKKMLINQKQLNPFNAVENLPMKMIKKKKKKKLLLKFVNKTVMSRDFFGQFLEVF